jgi:hypothetical protein
MKSLAREPLIAFLLCMGLAVGASAAQSRWGHYAGQLEAKFDQKDRDIVLLGDFVYTDPNGKIWKAPAGSRVDGASIPQIFWSFIGGPLDGVYREASVIHDVACQLRDQPWEEVHLTFYNAMRCSGVGERRAKLMYWAVYHFGPRWGIGAAVRDIFSPQRTATEVDIKKAAEWIEKNNPSLDEIKKVEKLR